MKKILYILVALFMFTFLTGCDFKYKDGLQKGIDSFDGSNYTLNVYADCSETYSFKGEEEQSEYSYHVNIMVDGKRESYHYKNGEVEEIRYRERHKELVDLYRYVNETWNYIETVDASEAFSLFTVIDLSTIPHDEFVEVSEGKWVPNSNKYNEIYTANITDYLSDLAIEGHKYTYAVEGFAINIEDGVIKNVEFTLTENIVTPEGRYYYVIDYVLVYSEIGATTVVKPNLSK